MKRHFINTLDAYHKDPNRQTMWKVYLMLVKHGQIPNGHKPTLYAVGGKLATVANFGEGLRNKLT